MSSITDALEVPVESAEPGGPKRLGRIRDTPGWTLEARLDEVGWGLLFLLFAAALLPSGVAEYALVAGVGFLMLGLNVTRRAAGIEVRWFSIILGTVAVIAGVGAVAGVMIDALALFFLALGVVTIGGAVVRSR